MFPGLCVPGALLRIAELRQALVRLKTSMGEENISVKAKLNDLGRLHNGKTCKIN